MPLPSLVPGLRDEALRSSRRIELLIREPVDPRQAVTLFSAALGVEKVVGKSRCVLLGEAERPETIVSLCLAQGDR